MKPPKLSRMVAESIADALFKNAFGEEAVRLKLVLPNGEDGGGWCKSAVIDRIEATLDRRVVNEKLPNLNRGGE